MPVFEFRAVDGDGQVQSGMMHGASLDAVSRQLADKGWDVQSLGVAQSHDLGDFRGMEQPRVNTGGAAVATSQKPEAPPTEPRGKFQTDIAGPLVGGVPLTALHMFFRQMQSMLHAGINPAQALETLGAQQKHPKFRRVLFETKAHVMEGRPMSVGFQRYPEVFSPLVMSMVRAAEEGGFLSQQCKLIADYLQRDIELRNLIRRETAYPKIVFVAGLIIIVAAKAFIESMGADSSMLPAPYMAFGAVVIVLAALWIFVRLAKRQPAMMQIWDSFVSVMPWVGATYHGFAMAKFGRAFGTLMNSGVPVAQATKLAADASGNEAVRSKIYPIIPRMNDGESITEVFQSSRAFSPMVLDMLNVGEKTGNVSDMLDKVAEHYEDEGTTRARQMALIWGVVVFLGVAIFLLIFVILPFYQNMGAARTNI